MEVVGSESEAEMVCSLLRSAGIKCFHQMTNFGSGAADGMPLGGPREVMIREEDLTTALKVVQQAQG